jgi:hypothetical protein
MILGGINFLRLMKLKNLTLFLNMIVGFVLEIPGIQESSSSARTTPIEHRSV